MSRKQSMSPRRLAMIGGALILGLLAQQAGLDLGALNFDSPPAVSRSDESQTTPTRSAPSTKSAERIERAFAKRESGFMTTVEARVAKTLRDDNDGSRHQRFLIELPNGRTLLVAHNIDLAERVPIARGDMIQVRGQYEWNDRGGVLHWTHHDPDGDHEGGWILHDGKRTE